MLHLLLLIHVFFLNIFPAHLFIPHVVVPTCTYPERALITSSGTNDWVGRSNLLQLNDGTWIHFYRSSTSHFSDEGRLHIRFSGDQGESWSSEDTTSDGKAVVGFPIVGHGNQTDATEGIPVIAPNDDLLLLVREELPYSSGGTYIWRSVDRGVTWLDEGKINGDSTLLMGGQAITVDTEIYASFWIDAMADSIPPYKSVLYRSSDIGLTWNYVSDISSYVEQTNESGMVYLGGTTLLTALRDDKVKATYLRRSDDMGQTWEVLEDKTAIFGVLQRPKFRKIGTRLYLHGRQSSGIYSSGSVAVWYSDNMGAEWLGPMYMNPNIVADVGYGDMLPTTSGTIYSVHYEGNAYDTTIIQCTLEIPKRKF